MDWVVFLCLLIAQHCTGGAASAVTLSVDFDTPGCVLLTDDVDQKRQPARMSRHPIDSVSPSRSACMPRNGMCKIVISAGATSLVRTSAH